VILTIFNGLYGITVKNDMSIRLYFDWKTWSFVETVPFEKNGDIENILTYKYDTRKCRKNITYFSCLFSNGYTKTIFWGFTVWNVL
jgi:hypothetical protein